MTEPPPSGYRLLYSDEVSSELMACSDWLFWWGMRWCELDGTVGRPMRTWWSYAVPVDWASPKTNAELHVEIAALRAEIAELRRHLSPPVEDTTPTEFPYVWP